MDKIIAFYAWFAVLFFNGLYFIGVIAKLVKKPQFPPQKNKSPGKLCIIRPVSAMDFETYANTDDKLKQSYPNTEYVFVTEEKGQKKPLQELTDKKIKKLFAPASGQFSPKVEKMICAWEQTDSEFVAFTDSDIEVPDDLSEKLLAYFEDKNVAGVSCPCLTTMTGPVGKILMHNLCCDYLSICSLGVNVQKLEFLQGAFMIVRRSLVDKLGGIQQLHNTFGDDLRLGRILQNAGYSVRLAPLILIHPCTNNSSLQLLYRYHRWMIAQKSEISGKYYVELLFNPTVAPLVLYLSFSSFSLSALQAMIGTRILVALIVDFTFIKKLTRYNLIHSFLRPVGDIVHFTIQLIALISTRAVWQNRSYVVTMKGYIKKRISK